MKNMLRCLFITMILGIATQNANASFVMRNTTAFQYTTTKSEQNVLHSECNIKQRLKLWHPKIHLFSQSNGYKALVCGLAGLVIFPMGIKAISYANAGLKERQDVVMARTGKILGTISYVLLRWGYAGYWVGSLIRTQVSHKLWGNSLLNWVLAFCKGSQTTATDRNNPAPALYHIQIPLQRPSGLNSVLLKIGNTRSFQHIFIEEQVPGTFFGGLLENVISTVSQYLWLPAHIHKRIASQ